MFAHALDKDAISTLLSLHNAGTLKQLTPVTEPGPRESWTVTTSLGEYAVTLHEQKPFWQLVHEKDLLLFLHAHLDELGVAVPLPVANVAGGYLFPVGERYVCMTSPPPGRRVGAFEISPELCAQAGQALARFHVVARAFRGRRRHVHRPDVVRRWLRHFRAREALSDVTRTLEETLDGLRAPLGRLLPSGTIHGAFGLSALRVKGSALVAITDFASSSRGPLLMDVAESLHALAFAQRAFDEEKCRALLAGYAAVRPLRPVEKRGLHAHLTFVAARLASACIRDFELHLRADEVHGHQAFSHHIARLEALRVLRPSQARAWCPG